MPMSRTSTIARTTAETQITLTLNLDGTGQARVATGIGFLDHMLTAFARHSMCDLDIAATGDLHIDLHHTTEDIGIVLGQALVQAVGDKRGIARYGHAVVPMDEALVDAALDLSGRPFLAWDPRFERDKLGEMDTELFEEFFRAFAMNGLLTMHVRQLAGRNAHHVAEACFKAVARALRQATTADPRGGRVDTIHQGVAMNIYTAHLKAGRVPVLVREGWSWGAALLGPIWLFLQRAWIPALVMLALTLGLDRLVPPGWDIALNVGVFVLAGLVGRDLVRWTLDRRGYILAHVVQGRDQDDALSRMLTARPELATQLAERLE